MSIGAVLDPCSTKKVRRAGWLESDNRAAVRKEGGTQRRNAGYRRPIFAGAIKSTKTARMRFTRRILKVKSPNARMPFEKNDLPRHMDRSFKITCPRVHVRTRGFRNAESGLVRSAWENATRKDEKRTPKHEKARA